MRSISSRPPGFRQIDKENMLCPTGGILQLHYRYMRAFFRKSSFTKESSDEKNTFVHCPCDLSCNSLLCCYGTRYSHCSTHQTHRSQTHKHHRNLELHFIRIGRHGRMSTGGPASGTCTITKSGDTYTLKILSGRVCKPASMCTFTGQLSGNVPYPL